jgi:hypothetical protein
MSSAWSPQARLRLVAQLAARLGSDSEAFFGAYGLGAAYSQPGRGSNKKARINSALEEAERHGKVDAVLDAMSAYLDGAVETSELQVIDSWLICSRTHLYSRESREIAFSTPRRAPRVYLQVGVCAVTFALNSWAPASFSN